MAEKPSFTATFPAAAAVIGEFRKAFGPGVQPVYVNEGAAEIGRPLDETRYTVIGGADLVVKKPQKGGRGGR